MSDKIKLEDMTLRQIREVKTELQKKIGIAINNVILDFYDKYDCGEVVLDIETDEQRPIETDTGEIIIPQKYKYRMRIYFSKEYETDKTYSMPDNPDPKFYRDMLTKLAELFTPKEYVNPVGLRVLGEEIGKALEELKEKIENEAH